MTYVLGVKSMDHLSGVHPNLVKVVERAITLSDQDFGVYEGLRTLATQQEYMKRGVTRTLASKHLKQGDGFGHAVDLVPFVAGSFRWEWGSMYPIAAAMRIAAQEVGVPLRWGGAWDMPLLQISASPEGMKAAVAAYCARHPGPDFIDGPHYELADK